MCVSSLCETSLLNRKVLGRGRGREKREVCHFYRGIFTRKTQSEKDVDKAVEHFIMSSRRTSQDFLIDYYSLMLFLRDVLWFRS